MANKKSQNRLFNDFGFFYEGYLKKEISSILQIPFPHILLSHLIGNIYAFWILPSSSFREPKINFNNGGVTRVVKITTIIITV